MVKLCVCNCNTEPLTYKNPHLKLGGKNNYFQNYLSWNYFQNYTYLDIQKYLQEIKGTFKPFCLQKLKYSIAGRKNRQFLKTYLSFETDSYNNNYLNPAL